MSVWNLIYHYRNNKTAKLNELILAALNSKTFKMKETELYNQAFKFSLFTIFYNIIEGVISMVMGYKNETLILFGFGVDSFIEVMSGIGITVMIVRIRQNPESRKSTFEITALKITGTAFYLLAAGLTVGIILNIIHHHKPETTLWGVVIALVSIAVMTWLMTAKKTTGKQLGSAVIVADANCTKVCLYMSLVLLASSLIYELTGFAYADIIGTFGLIYFCVTEGKEAFEKAKGKDCDCEKC
jgi:divalent metal cation (Fe/Co/Zn/Cd) transporter